MQGQSSSPFSPGQLGLQILRVHRHLYKMGYSSDNAIHTHQRDTTMEVKALSFCHIGIGGQGGESGQKELMTIAEKPVLSTNCIIKFPRSEPIYLWYE